MNTHTKELQIITYITFGGKKGFFPLDIEFESKFLASMTRLTDSFPFGTHSAQFDAHVHDAFTFQCNRGGQL